MTTKFQKKIFMNISIIMVLFLAGLIFIFSRDSYQKLSESRKNNLLVLSSKTADSFSSLLQDMDTIALHIASNASIRDVFYKAQKEGLTNAEIYGAIKNDFIFLLVPVDTSRFRINLYNAEGNFISAGIPYSSTDVKEFLSSPSYKAYYDGVSIEQSKLLSGFHTDLWSSSDVSYLSSYRELNATSNAKNRVALIEIQCGFNTVDSILSLLQSGTSTLLVNPQGEIAYASLTNAESGSEELALSYIDKLDSLDGNVFQDSQNLVTAVGLANDWNLLFIQSLDSPWQLMDSYLLLTIIMALVCLSSALFIVFMVVKYNTKPLQNLTRSLQELSLTSPYLDIDPSKYSDEMVNLAEAFNQMVNKLTLSMEENARAREYEMRANLVALQSQMDPHFLYNMLSVINSYDSEADFKKIHQICLYMSSMLRYISSHLDNAATLEMELAHTRHYLQLMKYRFEDQFDYTISVDEGTSLDKIMVPKLILQPILENCFQHGFKKVLPPWKISVTIRSVHEDEWSITIEDNGCGFSPEKQEELRQKINNFSDSPLRSIEALKIGGMGLLNTLIRIRFFLKETFFYEIETMGVSGTRIRIGGKKKC